jgi:hypothetical protein
VWGEHASQLQAPSLNHPFICHRRRNAAGASSASPSLLSPLPPASYLEGELLGHGNQGLLVGNRYPQLL